MKIIKQLGIILIFCVLGELVSYGFKKLIPTLVIPGTILGMIFMITALFAKKLKVEAVEDVGVFFTENMSFFFVPAAVSVMEHFGILGPIVFQLLTIVVVGSILTYTFTLLSVRITIVIQEKYRVKRGQSHE